MPANPDKPAVVPETGGLGDWQMVVATLPLPAVLFDADGGVVANSAASRLLGQTSEAIAGISWASLIHPAELGAVEAFLRTVFQHPAKVWTGRFRPAGAEAADRLQVMGAVVSGERAPAIAFGVLAVGDPAAAHDRFLQRVYSTDREGLFILDEQFTLLTANPSFCSQMERSLADLAGKRLDWLDLARLPDLLRESDRWEGEVRLPGGQSEDVPHWVILERDPGGTDTPSALIGRCLSARHCNALEQRLQTLTHYDVLTGLPNRVLLLDRLQQNVARTARAKGQLAVLSLDLDRFKKINDTFGHSAGDLLLRDVSQLLSACLREEDTIARTGGDEFIIVLGSVTDRTAAGVAQRILAAFANPLRVDGRDVFLSTSIGIAIFPLDGHNADTLLKNAETAMYHAKEGGKSTYQFYSASMNIRALERLEMETRLRRALERDEFLLHYQPRVDARTGRVVGMEALVRWMHPELGLVPPLHFIPLAEETGLIVPLGDWVLRSACTQARVWAEAGLSGLCLSVNVSARQFHHHDPVQSLIRAVDESGIDPAGLEVELTESILMLDLPASISKMNKIREMGVRLSIDDFGTGYSSLSYLKRFPIQTLKIDRSFVRDIPQDTDNSAIAAAIIAMTHSLKLRVVAEGVETLDQLRFLVDRGCDEVQGFYYSRPVPPAEFERLARAESLPLPEPK